MWYDNLSNNRFLLSLYNKVPDLDNVRVEELAVLEEGDKIKLVFDMPKFADNIPTKWLKIGSNTVAVEMNFWNIYDFKMNFSKLPCRGNINITYDDKGYLMIFLEGSMYCEFVAEFGMIQKIESYKKNDETTNVCSD